MVLGTIRLEPLCGMASRDSMGPDASNEPRAINPALATYGLLKVTPKGSALLMSESTRTLTSKSLVRVVWRKRKSVGHPPLLHKAPPPLRTARRPSVQVSISSCHVNVPTVSNVSAALHTRPVTVEPGTIGVDARS